MKLSRLLCAVFGCFFLLALSGKIVTAADFSVGIGGSVGSSPYKDYDTQWNVVPLVGFENEYAYIRGYTAGVKILNLDYLELSAFGGYDGTRFNAGDSSNWRLRKLKNRYSSAEAGMELRLLSPYGMLHASAARDILGNSDGWKGAIGYRQSLEYGPVEFIPAVGGYWMSSRYNDYYYGVSCKEAHKSGLAAYDAGAGVSPYLGLTISYSITQKWDVFCSGEMVFLNKAVKDSPMVGGSQTQSVTTGVMYNF